MRTHKEFVTVELGTNGLPIRIFNSRKLACLDPSLDIGEMRRGAAVRIIREQVVARAAGKCEKCHRPIGPEGDMHERLPRGKGGEISLSNSVYIHRHCHIWAPDAEHANRRPQWTKRP